MERLARGLAWKGGAILMILLVLLIILWANLNSMIAENCTNRIVSEIPSPDNIIKAVVFQRYCGSNATISTHVSLLSVSDTLENRKGNLFISEGNAKRVRVRVVWKSPAAIELSHKSHWRILRSVDHLMGVAVSYPGSTARVPETKNK